MADNQFIKIMNLRHPRHLRLKNQTDKLSFRNTMQAITQYAHIIYTKPMEIRMPHVVGAALAVAPMQGGGKPRPATVFPGNACGVQRKLYLCGKISRQASQRCSNRACFYFYTLWRTKEKSYLWRTKEKSYYTSRTMK